MEVDRFIKMLFYLFGPAFCATIAYGCMDPPNLYQSFPSPVHRYFARPKMGIVETVGGLPVSGKKNSLNLFFLRSIYRRLNKRQNTGCRPKTISLRDAGVEERALCNWRYVPKHNSSRYPNIVLEAETSCHECSEFSNGDVVRLGNCEPVYRSFQVLERVGCENGIYQYDPTYIKIKVAFVCARPRVAPATDIIENNLDLSFIGRR